MNFISEEQSDEFFQFINKNIDKDASSLRLSSCGKDLGFDTTFAITQIEGRRKYKRKLNKLFNSSYTLIPDILACEQASHQSVAAFHASLISAEQTCLDMTAGLGIDIIAMSSLCSKAIAIEMDTNRAKILRYNASILGLSNLEVINANSVEYISKRDECYDVIYIDPARRDENKKRVYGLQDCTPDILQILPILKGKFGRLMVKCSPMLDISKTLIDFPDISTLYVICVEGKCKEILAVISAQTEQNNQLIDIKSVDLQNNGNIISKFSYYLPTHIDKQSFSHPTERPLSYAEEEDINSCKYLYEPNASIMKLSPWHEIQKAFPKLKKIAPSSHLFISHEYYSQFPGRVLKIDRIVDSKQERTTIIGSPLNVVVRNYPSMPDEIRKKLRLKEGNEKFLYATTLSSSKKLMILATRIRANEADQNLKPAESIT